MCLLKIGTEMLAWSKLMCLPAVRLPSFVSTGHGDASELHLPSLNLKNPNGYQQWFTHFQSFLFDDWSGWRNPHFGLGKTFILVGSIGPHGRPCGDCWVRAPLRRRCSRCGAVLWRVWRVEFAGKIPQLVRWCSHDLPIYIDRLD